MNEIAAIWPSNKPFLHLFALRTTCPSQKSTGRVGIREDNFSMTGNSGNYPRNPLNCLTFWRWWVWNDGRNSDGFRQTLCNATHAVSSETMAGIAMDSDAGLPAVPPNCWIVWNDGRNSDGFRLPSLCSSALALSSETMAGIAMDSDKVNLP